MQLTAHTASGRSLSQRFAGKLDDLRNAKSTAASKKYHQAQQTEAELKAEQTHQHFTRHQTAIRRLLNQTQVRETVDGKTFKFSGWDLLAEISQEPNRGTVTQAFSKPNQDLITGFLDQLVELKLLNAGTKREWVSRADDWYEDVPALYVNQDTGDFKLDIEHRQFGKQP